VPDTVVSQESLQREGPGNFYSSYLAAQLFSPEHLRVVMLANVRLIISGV